MSRTEAGPARDCVRLDAVGSVAWIRMERPDVMNALSLELLDELDAALQDVERDHAIRVAVLTGSGRAFCAGADLKGLFANDGSFDPERLLTIMRRAVATIERIPAMRKPVIAAVNGVAAAGGLELLLACDLVVAARSARVGDAHSNYGLVPGGGGAARLARVVGPTVAKYLAFTGVLLPAEELTQYGLVNDVVADEELEPRVQRLGEEIARKSPPGLAHMKRVIDDALDQPLDTALRLEQLALTVQVHSNDTREGLAAFREKRAPKFSPDQPGDQ